MSVDLRTRAIVLHRTPYTDRYAIVHLYTQEYGRLGVLVPEGRTKQRRYHLLLTPLSEVELTATLRPRRELALVGEVRLVAPRHAIQLNPSKRSQGLFIGELLYRVLSHPEPDDRLYTFIASSLEVLELLELGVANFYLCFAYRLLEYLAIAPPLGRSVPLGQPWYDLEEACFTHAPRLARHALPPAEASHLLLFARMHYGNLGAFRYSREQRGQIIDRLLLYYRLHLPPFPVLRSLEILRSSAVVPSSSPAPMP